MLYLNMCLTRRERSLLCQLRMGVLSIRVETGRFRNITLEHRICEICQLNLVEDEIHFVTVCPKYNNLRKKLYAHVQFEDFSDLDNENKFTYIMVNHQRDVAKYVVSAMDIRTNVLYR